MSLHGHNYVVLFGSSHNRVQKCNRLHCCKSFAGARCMYCKPKTWAEAAELWDTGWRDGPRILVTEYEQGAKCSWKMEEGAICVHVVT